MPDLATCINLSDCLIILTGLVKASTQMTLVQCVGSSFVQRHAQMNLLLGTDAVEVDVTTLFVSIF